jgi:hypothetical protein
MTRVPHVRASGSGCRRFLGLIGMWRQVDRSAAYAARWVAKSIVAAGLAKRCIVQVAYAIGIAKPLSTYVNTYGTGTRPDSEILDIVHKNFDLRPFAIIKVSASPERNSARAHAQCTSFRSIISPGLLAPSCLCSCLGTLS